MAGTQYDALLIVSFGGPEGPDEVIPFLENVLRGKNVPRERMLEVAEHYYHFGGKSPINEQNRALIEALREELDRQGIGLPIYWGNRNWHPLLADTMRRMKEDGAKRALALMTSAFSSYSGCRQYREDLSRAAAEIGPEAPEIDKIRVFFNHPGFVEAMVDRVKEALGSIPQERRAGCPVIFTAHSIPMAMAAGASYVPQLEEACRLIAGALGIEGWQLAYQSRSGPPNQPWLEPDVLETLRRVREAGARDAVVVPVGFISDHMEVLYDLDTEAADVSREIGLNLVRAGTAGAHPRFVAGIVELIRERLEGAEKRSLGAMGAFPDVCPVGCCPAPQRPAGAHRPVAAG